MLTDDKTKMWKESNWKGSEVGVSLACHNLFYWAATFFVVQVILKNVGWNFINSFILIWNFEGYVFGSYQESVVTYILFSRLFSKETAVLRHRQHTSRTHLLVLGLLSSDVHTINPGAVCKCKTTSVTAALLLQEIYIIFVILLKIKKLYSS